MKKLEFIKLKEAWKLWSVQIFVLIAAIPDIYNAVANLGWLDETPPELKWVIRSLAVVGIVARIVKQKKVDENK